MRKQQGKDYCTVGRHKVGTDESDTMYRKVEEYVDPKYDVKEPITIQHAEFTNPDDSGGDKFIRWRKDTEKAVVEMKKTQKYKDLSLHGKFDAEEEVWQDLYWNKFDEYNEKFG